MGNVEEPKQNTSIKPNLSVSQNYPKSNMNSQPQYQQQYQPQYQAQVQPPNDIKQLNFDQDQDDDNQQGNDKPSNI
jgi:hypothetical protein